jgi:hypothetical protein
VHAGIGQREGPVAGVARQRDARGRVFEPRDPERLLGQGQVHVVITEPDCLRVCSFFSTTHTRSRGLSLLA